MKRSDLIAIALVVIVALVTTVAALWMNGLQ
jgi:hypothetical protein